VQQLGIPWAAPTDPIFKFAENDAVTGGNSMMGGQNTSVMDSSKHGMSKSEIVDDGQMSNSTAHQENADLKENFYKVKNVFEILIAEASYLIDDKAFMSCEGKSDTEKFLIMVDSIRKSLNIESMDDVELLIQTFYEFGDKKKQRLKEAEEKRLAMREDQQANMPPVPVAPKDGKKAGEKGKENGKGQAQEIPTYEDEDDEEKDPTQPDIELDDVVEILNEYNGIRQDKLDNQDFVNPSKKKKSNFQTDEQKLERQKKDERQFWERMTKVLSDKGHALWRALDKALTKYYALLVERQNLIEETGLLNQQNEELKTLLNQYLQAGVNHDLKVPPTQVIRLDI